MVDFRFALIEHFSLSITVLDLRRNVYSSAIFTGGRPLCTQLLPGQSRPHQPFLASEN